jgi:hypothetical protein
VTSRTAFFAFPSEPPELKGPIIAAHKHVINHPGIRIVAWPHLPVFGGCIPEEVRDEIQKADVLLCDITRPNANVYYEIGYCVGCGESLAPVVNVSFANAIADIATDGLFCPPSALIGQLPGGRKEAPGWRYSPCRHLGRGPRSSA